MLLWDLTPSTLVVRYQHFEGTCHPKDCNFHTKLHEVLNLTQNLLLCIIPAQIQTFIALWHEVFDPPPTEVKVQFFSLFGHFNLWRWGHTNASQGWKLIYPVTCYLIPNEEHPQNLYVCCCLYFVHSFHLCSFPDLKQTKTAKTDVNVGTAMKQLLNKQDTDFSGQGIKILSQSMTHVTACMKNTENILTLI